MKSKSIIITLIISVAFNIGFLFMFFTLQAEPEPIMPTRQPRTERGHRFRQSDELRELRRENVAIRGEFFDLLAHENYQLPELDTIIEKMLESQHRLETEVINHFLSIRAGMTPEEAAEHFTDFQSRQRERRGRGRQEGGQPRGERQERRGER
jgi:hypothetical protein